MSCLVPAIAFYYYGIRRCCGGLYGICIDCYDDKPNYIPIDALNRTDDGGNPPVCALDRSPRYPTIRLTFAQVVLFSMRFKTPGIHEIIIRNENDTRINPSGNSQLTLDRIELEVVDNTLASTSASSFTSTTTSNSDFKPTASSSASGSHHTSIVVGALGGSFAAVLILLILFWFCQRRRRKASATSTGLLSSMEPFAYASLPPSPIVAPANVVVQNSTTLPTRNPQYPGRYGYILLPRKEAQDNVLPPSASSSSQPSSPPSSNQPRREQDAGPLPADTEGSTLPPDYNQLF